MAWTASSRRPSRWNSSSHMRALSRTKSRTASQPAAVVVDGRAPGGPVVVGEVGAELAQVVALRAEVVVDDVEEDRQAVRVAGVDQPLQPVRPAVAVLGGVGEDAVVAPVAAAGELGDRHQLDRGDAQLAQVAAAAG